MTATQARGLAKQYAGQVAQGIDVQAEKQEKREKQRSDTPKSLRAFLECHYEEWLLINNRSGKREVQRIKGQFEFLLDLPINRVHVWHIQKWQAKKLKEGCSRSTVGRNLATIRTCFSRGMKWGFFDVNPLAELPSISANGRTTTRYLLKDEESRLRAALRERDSDLRKKRGRYNAWRDERHLEPFPSLSEQQFADHLEPMILLSLNTGLRRGELFSLRWSNVDLQGKNLSVSGEDAKSGKSREIPLNEEAYEVLEHWKAGVSNADGNLVFPNKSNEPFRDVKRAWSTIKARSAITGFRWHDLRHTFASNLAMNGVAINSIRELLGHSDLTMTLRYAHLSPNHLSTAVETLSPTISRSSQYGQPIKMGT